MIWFMILLDLKTLKGQGPDIITDMSSHHNKFATSASSCDAKTQKNKFFLNFTLNIFHLLFFVFTFVIVFPSGFLLFNFQKCLSFIYFSFFYKKPWFKRVTSI